MINSKCDELSFSKSIEENNKRINDAKADLIQNVLFGYLGRTPDISDYKKVKLLSFIGDVNKEYFTYDTKQLGCVEYIIEYASQGIKQRIEYTPLN